MSSQEGQPSPPCVLVVEDDEVERSVLQSALEAHGFTVKVAVDGFHAVRLLRDSAFDLALVDYQMPEMDGLAAAKLIFNLLGEDARPRMIAFTSAPNRLAARLVASDTTFDEAVAKAAKHGAPSPVVTESCDATGGRIGVPIRRMSLPACLKNFAYEGHALSGCAVRKPLAPAACSGWSCRWRRSERFPWALEDAMPATSTTASACPLRVLVLDDVAMNRDIAGSFRCAAGYEVVCAEAGAKAVRFAAASDFDVVLTDVRMPGMDGLEATRRIRTLAGPRGRVPIVALPAQAFAEQVSECRKAGMDSHLAKPFTPDALRDAVAHAVAAGPPRGEAAALPEDMGQPAAALGSEPAGA